MTDKDGLARFSARSVRGAARKPWLAAVAVAHAARRRASEALADAPASPAALLPTRRTA